MTDTTAIEATRRHLTERQAEVVSQLVEAAAEEVEENGYAGLTVRNVARRAGVAPATAYNYFSSKDHLLAELLWRRMAAQPPVVAVDRLPAGDRLTQAVAQMLLFTSESPALLGACTTALLSDSPDVRHLRDRIGAENHRRLAAALGDDADPQVVQVLDVTYAGALLMAGMGHLPYGDVPAFIAQAARLLTGGGTGARS